MPSGRNAQIDDKNINNICIYDMTSSGSNANIIPHNEVTCLT